MTQVFSNCATYLGKYAISGDLNAVAINSEIDALEKTAMGDGTRKFKRGLRSVSADMEGFYNPGAGLISPILDETYFNLQNVPFTVIPEGYLENCRAYSFLADMATFNSFGGVGEMMKFRATAEGCGVKLIPGYMAFVGIKAAAGVTTSTGVLIPGGAPAGYTVFGALHVITATAGDTLDIKIQSDAAAGFPHPTDAISFNQVAGIAKYEWASHPGAAAHDEGYWRIESTVVDAGGGGVSFGFAVFFGIVPN